MYAFAATANIPHRRTGKLIVAQRGEEAALDALFQRAVSNGVELQEVDRAFVKGREPHIAAEHAAWSPATGWIDAEAYIRALADDVVRRDGVMLTGTTLVAVEQSDEKIVVITERERIDASAVVNAAGLFADDVSAICGGEAFQIFPCRGEYAELAPRARHLINGLVYPVPRKPLAAPFGSDRRFTISRTNRITSAIACRLERSWSRRERYCRQ